MTHTTIRTIALVIMISAPGQVQVRAQDAKATYPSIAPLEQYLITDRDAEIALARSAAPKSISDSAEIMALGRNGYTTVAKGSNGFVCIVERSWGAATDEPDFWNPKVRAPICFNPQAAESFLPIYLIKTKFVLAGKSKAEIAKAWTLDKKELPAAGGMCYMMSKQQYLNDRGKSWHPHLMFIVPGDSAKSWGADLEGSPVIAANDPEERVTIFMVWVGKWSDGTAYSEHEH